MVLTEPIVKVSKYLKWKLKVAKRRPLGGDAAAQSRQKKCSSFELSIQDWRRIDFWLNNSSLLLVSHFTCARSWRYIFELVAVKWSELVISQNIIIIIDRHDFELKQVAKIWARPDSVLDSWLHNRIVNVLCWAGAVRCWIQKAQDEIELKELGPIAV